MDQQSGGPAPTIKSPPMSAVSIFVIDMMIANVKKMMELMSVLFFAFCHPQVL
jgi:hypothetical protein